MNLRKRFLDAIGYKAPDAHEGDLPLDKHGCIDITRIVSGPATSHVDLAAGITTFDTRITYLDVGPDDKVVLIAADSVSREAYLRARRLLNAALRRPGRVGIVIESGMTVTVIKPKRVNALVSDALTDELRKMKGEMDGVEPATSGKTVPVVPIGDELSTASVIGLVNRSNGFPANGVEPAAYSPLNKDRK